jgi:hypothetical protein
LLVATAVVLAFASRKPATKIVPAGLPASTAASTTRFTALARVSAFKSAVRSTNASTAAYDCGPSSGMNSGSSGDNRARRAARSTVRFNDASSSTFVEADARRRPTAIDTVSVVSVTPPDVVMLASAKRVLPLHSLVMLTRACSPALRESTRAASAFASSRVSRPGPPTLATPCALKTSAVCSGWSRCGTAPARNRGSPN